MKLETLAIHAGRSTGPGGAVSPSPILSTTFEREADGSYPDGHIYTRSSNPGRAALETLLAAIEGGHSAAAFGSGSAAAWVRGGDTVLRNNLTRGEIINW